MTEWIDEDNDDDAFASLRALLGSEPDPPPEAATKDAELDSTLFATHGILRTGALLVVPADNLSRGGTILGPDHPDVQALVETIRRGELAHDLGARPLAQPIDRSDCQYPCCGGYPLAHLPYDRTSPTHHTHRIDYGFSRYVAHRVLGRRVIECKIKDRTDDEATRIGLVENLNRSAPTDYQIAVALKAVKDKHQWDAARIAVEVGAREHDVDTLLRIVEHCPPDLVDRFRATPTKDVRRALARISRIEGRTPDEQHKRMREEWARHEAAMRAAAAKPRPPGVAPGGIGRQGVPNPLGRAGLLALRAAVADATEWFDPATGAWRPLSPEARDALAAVLGHAVAPAAVRRPLRRAGDPGSGG